MKLTSLNRISSLLIILVLISPLKAEEEINIWNKSKEKQFYYISGKLRKVEVLKNEAQSFERKLFFK